MPPERRYPGSRRDTDHPKKRENRMKSLIPIIAASFIGAAFVGASSAEDVQDKQEKVAEKQQEVKEAQQEVKEAQQELKQETKKEAAKQAEASNKTMQQVSRASKIIGASVTNPAGDSLGDIKELVVNPESGQVVYAVVSYGGVMGMGDKLFAVPWKALTWHQDKENYTLNVDKATLAKAPGFDKNHWPESSIHWDQQREEIHQFYRVVP
jgi:sporulation protein YlmC with PRC-barrel domain